jgi:hypothetical protein
VTREVFAVWFYDLGWLLDSCAGGVFCSDEQAAKWWETWDEAEAEMKACELGEPQVNFEVRRIQVAQPDE